MEASRETDQPTGEDRSAGSGVWVGYHGDFSDLAVFPDELSARRYAADNYMSAEFMVFGKSFRDQIRESRRPVHHHRALDSNGHSEINGEDAVEEGKTW